MSTSPDSEIAAQDQTSNVDDDEGLLTKYDVVLCGTGLVQSLVAAALSRAGKSVLHVDGSDYYGELDAVWTLPYVIGQRSDQQCQQQDETEAVEELSCFREVLLSNDEKLLPLHSEGASRSLKIHSVVSRTNVEDYPLEVGTEVSTPFGIGWIKEMTVKDQDGNDADTSQSLATDRYASVVIRLESPCSSNPSSMTMHVGVPLTDVPWGTQSELSSLNHSLLASHRVVPLAAIQAQIVLEQRSRSFALDITPALLYCAGSSVQALLESQVSEYLEFKSINSLLWYDKVSSPHKLQKVPCSKSDVFSSSLLSPLEKRRLMKFLQLALDYAIMEEEKMSDDALHSNSTSGGDDTASDSVPSSSEAAVQSLNERRLNRGRSLIRPQNKAVAKDDLRILQDCIQQGMSFDTYLKSQAKLSESLTSLVQYALSLILSEQRIVSSDDSSSHERAGSTPLQVGMEALCLHMASLGKFGTTGFLYTVYGSGELPQAFCRSAAVYGATYLLRRQPRGVVLDVSNNQIVGICIDQSSDEEGEENKGDNPIKRVACDNVVIPQASLGDRQSANGSASTRQVLRRISILRGKCVGEDPAAQQQHLVIFPPFSIDPQHSYAIHALLLDDHVKVAPHVPCGCTMVHLTTVGSTINDDAAAQADVLAKAVQALLSVKSHSDKGNCTECQEIFHVSFSYKLDDIVSSDVENTTLNASGLHVIQRSLVGVGQENAYEQAREIFCQICPDEDFLKVATKVAEKAIQRQVDDDEEHVLDKAMEMIQQISGEPESKEQVLT